MPDVPPRKAAKVSDVVVAVLWSLFGVRKGRDLERDAASIRPWQVVVVAVAIVATFVVLLIIAVRVIVGGAR